MPCGFCHQVAYVLAESLVRNGISARAYGLNGHVVTQFEANGTSYISDPDFGIGPYIYAPSMWEHVREDYAAVAGKDSPWMDAIKKPFLHIADDAEYHSMKSLTKMSLLQALVVAILEWMSVFSIALGTVLLFLYARNFTIR